VNGPLLILDSATLYYRAFYALPEKMVAPDGSPHNAVRGFLSMVTKLIAIHQPRGLIAAWDNDWRPEWRVRLVPSYKAHRLAETSIQGSTEEIPDTLSPQIGAIAKILDYCGIARIGVNGFEADDIIASAVHQIPGSKMIVTSDKDLFQIISHSASVLLQVNGGIDSWPLIGPEDIKSRYNVNVEQYLDFAALRGDPSDGLPGIAGIGEKTASSLIHTFGSLEKLYHVAQSAEIAKPLTPRLANKILLGKDYLMAARQVITAEKNLPIHKWDYHIPSAASHPKKLAQISRDWGVEKFVQNLYQAVDA
jgi:5'-3' exonuclease